MPPSTKRPGGACRGTNNHTSHGRKRMTAGNDSKKASQQNKPAPQQSQLSRAFFSGGIRDTTTKQSRKAAEDLAILKNKSKNPQWKPLNSKGASVNINTINAAKASVLVRGFAPSSAADSLSVASANNQENAASHSQQPVDVLHDSNHPVRLEVRMELHRRMEALVKSGQTFEDHAAYVDNDRDAEDARLILQGKDPAAHEAQRNGARFVQHRAIPVEKRHWVASMQGLMYVLRLPVCVG